MSAESSTPSRMGTRWSRRRRGVVRVGISNISTPLAEAYRTNLLPAFAGRIGAGVAGEPAHRPKSSLAQDGAGGLPVSLDDGARAARLTRHLQPMGRKGEIDTMIPILRQSEGIPKVRNACWFDPHADIACG